MQPSSLRTERGICLGLFLVGCGLALMLAPLRLDIADDGLYMYQANLVAHGGIPYQDFFLHDPPFGTYWHALLLALFGNDLLVLRLAVVPFKAVVLPAVYLLARPLVPRLPAVAAALVVPIVDTNIEYDVAHVALNALGLGICGIVLLMVGQRRARLPWLLAAGAMFGLATGFKQNMGLYFLAGAGLWLLEAPPPGGKPGPPATGAPGRAGARDAVARLAAWAIVLAAVLWLVKDHLEPGVLGSLVLPLVLLAGGAGLPGRSATPARGGAAAVRRLGVLGLGFALTTVPWLAWSVLQVGPHVLLEGLLIVPSQLGATWFVILRPPTADFWWFVLLFVTGAGIAAGAASLSGRLHGARAAPWIAAGALVAWAGVWLLASPLQGIVFTGLIYTWLYLNIIVFWPALFLLRRLPLGPARSHARLLLITAALLALEMYPQMRRLYADWCFPLYLPLAAWVVWRGAGLLARAAPGAPRLRGQAAPAIVLGLLPLCVGWMAINWRLAEYLNIPATLAAGRPVAAPFGPTDLPHFHVSDTFANGAAYRRLAAVIAAHTRPGEPIYCLYRQVAFYVATDRPAGVVNVYAPPGMLLRDGLTIRAELGRNHVRLILADADFFAPGALSGRLAPASADAWVLPIRDYIAANFQQVAVAGQWSVWAR